MIRGFRGSRRKNGTAAIILFAAAALGPVAFANSSAEEVKSGFVTTADGMKIHYLEAGHVTITGTMQIGGTPPPGSATKGQVSISNTRQLPTLLFVPGWTMPAWIWQEQIEYFAPKYHVIAMDPRCQGDSSQTTEGLDPAARARDIKAVVDQMQLSPVVLVGWSMAVTEVLAYVDQFGTKDIAGLVLVDDTAGGNDPAKAQGALQFIGQILRDRQTGVPEFVRKYFFKQPQPTGYIEKVIQASLAVPTSTAVSLLVGKFSADYRATLPKIDRPTLACAARSPYMDGVVQMQKQIPGSQMEIFEHSGHALFVDEPDQFNAALEKLLAGLH
jgi:non-heme chloroperoxidase